MRPVPVPDPRSPGKWEGSYSKLFYGGDLQGIAYWNYNVREQGLYNDTHDTAYHTETMFDAIFAQARELLDN